jgi:hypothetical protein
MRPLPAGGRDGIVTEEVAMTYTAAAVEPTMKVQEVIFQALSGLRS